MGIVHRDINPHNVLIGWDGVVKLIDFGIAKSDVSGFHTAVGTIKGKFAYMSPEQSAADPLDARSDLFSAAIVLYEALTLDNPFSRPNVVLALEAIQLHPVSPPSSTRSDATAMDDVLMRCLEKNPDLRFASAAAFADALALCVDRLPESPGPLSALMRVIFATDIRAETRQFERLGIEAPVDDQPTDPGQPAPGPTTDAPPKVAAGSLSPPLPTEPGLTGRTLPDADPCHPAPLPAAVSDHEPLARRVPTIIRRGAERADRASEHASSSGVRGPEADAFVSSSAAARGRMPEASAPALGSGLGTSGSGPESGSRLPSVKRRPWIGYGVLLAITTVGSFGITRAVMQPRAAAVAPSPVGTLRIEAEPELWVRIAGSAWLRTPIEAQLLEPTGALELRTEGGVTRRATFRVQGRRLDLRVRGRGISVGTPKTQTGLRTFTIEGPGEVTGSFHWTPPSSEKSRSRG
jgi:serine/threonine-protein kinase